MEGLKESTERAIKRIEEKLIKVLDVMNSSRAEVRYNVNQKIERPGTWAEHAFELCRDGIKTSKAKITTVEEFKHSLEQVFKCHPFATQEVRFAYLLEHTTGPAHNLVAMCKGEEDCFYKAWNLIAKE